MSLESIPATEPTPQIDTFEGLMAYADLLLEKPEKREGTLAIVESLKQFLYEQKSHAQQALNSSPALKSHILNYLDDIFKRAMSGAYEDLKSA